MMQETALELRSLLGLLQRQIRIIVLTAVLVLGLALLWLFSVTPLYTASTLIMIDTGSADLLNPQEERSSAAADNSRVASEVEILRSSATALAVVRNADLIGTEEFGPSTSLLRRISAQLGFAQTSEVSSEQLVRQVVNKYRNALTVRRRGLTYLIEVSVTSENRHRAADLANITAQTYIDEQVASKIGSALTARDVIQARLTQANADLIEAERAFDTFIDDNLGRIAAESGRADLEALRAELLAVEGEAAAARADLNTLNAARTSGAWDELARALDDDVLADLQTQRDALNSQLASAAEDQALTLRTELEALDTMLANRSDAALADMRGAVSSLEEREAVFQEELRGSVLGANLPPELLTQVFSIQQRGTLARTQYQTLLSRLRDFETQADLQVADARVVAPALPPSGASFPDRRLVLALGLIGGLGMGIGLGMLREFYIGGFTSETQVADVLGVPVPGAMPRLDQDEAESPAQAIVSAPLSLYAESLRRLRASIDQARYRTSGGAQPEGPLTVMVASTLPAEGKTTTSLSLARTYAQSGSRTLLIDCDLRKPSIAGTLKLTATKGLLDYLTNPAELDLEAIMALDTETDLEIIPSIGRSNRPTDQLLTSQAFIRLIEAVRKHYDVIVLDTPPVLPVVDARYLAHHADAIALVIKWAETRQQDVRQTLSILEESRNEGTPIFAVLNQQSGRRARTYYQGYYGYGSGGYTRD